MYIIYINSKTKYLFYSFKSNIFAYTKCLFILKPFPLNALRFTRSCCTTVVVPAQFDFTIKKVRK